VQDRGALVLRSFSKWEWSPKSDNDAGYAPRKVGGHGVKFTSDERSKGLEAQVISINEFLRKFSIRGGRFSGFYRGFNQGKDPDAFNWNKGGRLYAYGQDSYQSLSGAQRALITINDEPINHVLSKIDNWLPSLGTTWYSNDLSARGCFLVG
jgi:hypothetical protein